MANGRGSLECCYCEFFRSYNPQWQGWDAAYELGHCTLHNAQIPESPLNRICVNFKPNQFFHRNSSVSVEERLSWFPTSFRPGGLYVFSYNTPEELSLLFEFNSNAPPA